MPDTPATYKRSKSRKKSDPGKRVAISDDMRKAYEEMMKAKDERDKTYTRHLSDSEIKR